MIVSDISSGILSAIVAVGTSTLTTLLIQTYLTKRVELRFARELEAYKAEIGLRAYTEHEIATRRLEAYPKIVELCYRTRNMARDLVNPASASPSLLAEMVDRARELEDALFKFRIDLEGDGKFAAAHQYKNLVRQFARIATSPELDVTSRGILAELYAEIDKSYPSIVSALSQASFMPKPPNSR